MTICGVCRTESPMKKDRNASCREMQFRRSGKTFIAPGCLAVPTISSIIALKVALLPFILIISSMSTPPQTMPVSPITTAAPSLLSTPHRVLRTATAMIGITAAAAKNTEITHKELVPLPSSLSLGFDDES